MNEVCWKELDMQRFRGNEVKFEVTHEGQQNWLRTHFTNTYFSDLHGELGLIDRSELFSAECLKTVRCIFWLGTLQMPGSRYLISDLNWEYHTQAWGAFGNWIVWKVIVSSLQILGHLRNCGMKCCKLHEITLQNTSLIPF